MAEPKRKGAAKSRGPSRSEARCISFKAARARSPWSFHRFGKAIEAKVYAIGKQYRVKIRCYQNAGNHLHVVAQAATRRELQNFLRVVPQAVAFQVTGTRRGNAIGRFWDGLVHSRIVHWGRDWRRMQDYMEKNRFEAAGLPRRRVDELYREIRMAWESG